jgi:hypothetical protein
VTEAAETAALVVVVVAQHTLFRATVQAWATAKAEAKLTIKAEQLPTVTVMLDSEVTAEQILVVVAVTAEVITVQADPALSLYDINKRI